MTEAELTGDQASASHAGLRLMDYLEHIQESITRIASYTAGFYESRFLSDRLVQDAVIRNLEILGEASRNVSRTHPEFAKLHPELPLSSAWEMRNALAHGYFKVDLTVVWRTIQNDLPELARQLAYVLAELRAKGP